ncbi:DUF928 domain-containing protein [Leptolyngbya sp. NIES-2104]|uniref:DUF928 domain-containing protein n=1 Tax=Leptolyngbya sp. NIES-2104 TaxID=1552121 RepID=UPI0006EC54FC|nr:DUF928 domain-containing protein [Leptolyngbya sp. NIES-2104]GAP98752.1 membrane protein related to metalloendopeptidase [Leptolyngbya sp. NIES-2104]
MNFSTTLTTLIVFSALSGQAQIALASAFDPPPGQGEPGSTAGGASRPSRPTCLDSDTFTVFAPKTYLGLTTQARPTFWIYLPSGRAKMLEFSVFDRQRKGIYQTQIAIENKSGLVKITLPETAPALNFNQSYNWTVALVCNSKRRTEDWVIGGWIARQAPTAELQREFNLALTDLDRARLYAQSQFWYDAISLLITSDQSSSKAFKDLWSSTIQAAGLDTIDNPHTQTIVNR